MSAEWIKMRVWLAKDPKVVAMSDFLATQREFMDWVTDPVRRHCEDSVYEHVTRNVTVSVTVAALLQVWGVANESGKVENDDLLLPHATVDGLDEICGIPCFGAAMAHVDWAIEDQSIPGKAAVRFPKFLTHNVPVEDRARNSNAERQRRFREAKRNEKRDVTRNGSRNVTSNVTVTHREDKKRTTPHTPEGDERFQLFWRAYPKKKSIATAYRAWTKINPSEQLTAEIVAAVQRAKTSIDWTKERGRFIPHPATWLNAQGWKDVLEQASSVLKLAI